MRLCDLNASELQEFLSTLTNEEKTAALYRWSEWAREKQLPPPGDWDGWLILAGRGWGKTKVGMEFIRAEVEAGRAKRIGIIAETSADGRDVLVEGESGILAVSPPWNKPTYEPSKRRLTWPNGAVATLYDAREPDQLRGPQHDLVLMDEFCKFRYPDDVYNQVMFGLRLGAHPRWIITTTPRPLKIINQMMNDSQVVVTHGKSTENLSNLAPNFRRNIIERYQGTRLGRQELNAEILGDVPGALWTRRGLDECRVPKAPELIRIVVAVDPAASSGENANENGIIVGGIAQNGHAYVIEDWSVKGTPDQWARRAVAAYRKHSADCLVAEANQGGEMVAMTINSVAPSLPVKLVHATRGKYVRAEPISALYEQQRCHHIGTLPELEDQMISFTPERSAKRESTKSEDKKSDSPDRVDALVWMLTELFKDIMNADDDGDDTSARHRRSDDLSWTKGLM